MRGLLFRFLPDVLHERLRGAGKLALSDPIGIDGEGDRVSRLLHVGFRRVAPVGMSRRNGECVSSRGQPRVIALLLTLNIGR